MITDTPDDPKTVASHTPAYLRSHGKKLDLILETLTRHGERLARVERDLGDSRRDLVEVKSDIALLSRDLRGKRQIGPPAELINHFESGS